MTEIVRYLYIGSLEDAKDEAALKHFDIRSMVSIGCPCPTPTNEQIQNRCAFEDVLDCPEQSLFKVLSETDKFIKSSLGFPHAVLVRI